MAKELQKKMAAKSGARFYVPKRLGNGSEVRLSPEAAHHAARVLRLAPGQMVTLFDGHGGEFEAHIVRIDRAEVAVKTAGHVAIERESPLTITLAQGLSSGDRMDFTLQKAVELGVSAIQPLATERSVVKLSEERAARRTEHWRNLVISACEQCGRNRVPKVANPCGFGEWLANLPNPALAGEARLLLSPHAAVSLRELPRPQGPLILLAGPEGGLAPGEVELAQSRGFRPVRLGPRVLRTETAALAALAALQAQWGDF
jgi:16S rRNA (uracil1498-N3)-methyltransferase